MLQRPKQMKMLSYHSIFVYSLCIDQLNSQKREGQNDMLSSQSKGRTQGPHGENQFSFCWQCRTLSGTSQATFIRQHLTLVSLLLSTAHIKQAATRSLDTRSRKVKRLSQGCPAKGEAEPRCKFWFQSGSSLAPDSVLFTCSPQLYHPVLENRNRIQTPPHR